MKLKGIALLTALNLVVAMTPAHADTVVFSQSFGGSNICEQIAGHWEGTGTVKKSIIECNYNGRGDIEVSKTDPGTFSMNIALTKTSGVCPAGEELHLNGTCENGVIKLTTPAELQGDLTSQDGKLAINNMAGKVWLMILGIRTSVDVTMKIHQTTPLPPRSK